MQIPLNKVTAFIGPSGCGKSTLLRCFNRMNDLIEGVRIEGKIFHHDVEIHSKEVDVVQLRTEVGMVFQQPNPFPMSIYDNVAYGLRCQGVKDRKILDEVVETSLKQAALWDEVKIILTAMQQSFPGSATKAMYSSCHFFNSGSYFDG